MSVSKDLDSSRTRLGMFFICFNLIFLHAASRTAYDELFFSFLLEHNLDQILVLLIFKEFHS